MSLGVHHTGFSGSQQTLIAKALTLIGAVAGGERIVSDLMRRRLCFDARLTDRAWTTMLRAIVLGPEVFQTDGERAALSLAGTLVHEHWHTRQNPLGKSWSFWAGVVTRTHPMRRYERPAYARQIAFLEKFAGIKPSLAPHALAEADEVREAFAFHYGLPPS